MEHIDPAIPELLLDDNASKHVLQVLRMKIGEQMHVTDGKGNIYDAIIHQQQKKQCTVKLVAHHSIPPSPHATTIAVSLVKNTARFEWFVEKATELGISRIVPLICERTERSHFRTDRMQSIVVSATLQSRQAWLPMLTDPVDFDKWVKQPRKGVKCIAHCMDDDKNNFREVANAEEDVVIGIGPEGDFSENEIKLALENSFIPVSLGTTRLRTETAAMAAAALLRIK